jgi:hypothetical protein
MKGADDEWTRRGVRGRGARGASRGHDKCALSDNLANAIEMIEMEILLHEGSFKKSVDCR